MSDKFQAEITIMLQLRRRLLGLCLIPVLLAASDASVTLRDSGRESAAAQLFRLGRIECP